jgi:hypothetical protein
MPYTTPTVNYCATIDGTYTSLTGIQFVSITRGRQRFQDNFTQTNCTIELIPATTYALPLAVGQFIDVRDANTNTSPCYFQGVITDIERQYAIPYNTVSSYAPADRITITATGATGAFGKQTLSNYALINKLGVISLSNLASVYNIFLNNFSTTASSIFNSAQTVNGGALDLANQLLRTVQYLIDDQDNQRTTTVGAEGDFTYLVAIFLAGQGNTSYTFSDAGTFGALKFSNLKYLSSVQNTFTEVQVVSPGNATQIASSGSAPFDTLVYDTYNADTSEALNLANYVLATQSSTTAVPYSITTNTTMSDNCTDISKMTINYYISSDQNQNIGAPVTVIFRGTTATATIQGINTTFYADYATVQLFLSPSLNSAFTLNSTVLGVLDTNRLGYP